MVFVGCQQASFYGMLLLSDAFYGKLSCWLIDSFLDVGMVYDSSTSTTGSRRKVKKAQIVHKKRRDLAASKEARHLHTYDVVTNHVILHLFGHLLFVDDNPGELFQSNPFIEGKGYDCGDISDFVIQLTKG